MNNGLQDLTWSVYVPAFLFSTGTGAINAVQVLAAVRVGASDALASALVACAAVISLLCTVPVGHAIDQLGDRRIMTLATAGVAATVAVTALALAIPGAWSLSLFGITMMLRAPAMAAWSLARQAVVADAVSPALLGRAMTVLGGMQRAGVLVGPLLGALVLLRLPLWGVYVLGVVCALSATLTLHLSSPVERRDRTAVGLMEDTSGASEEIRWWAVWLAGAAIVTLTVARVGQPILVTLWGTRLGWSEAQISLLTAVGTGVELLMLMPGGLLKDLLGRSLVLCCCLAGFGIGFGLLAGWGGSAGLVTAVVVMSLGNGLVAGINMTIGADLSPRTGRARFLGVWSLFNQVGIIAGPLIISGVLLAGSLSWATLSLGLLSCAGAVWTVAVFWMDEAAGKAEQVRVNGIGWRFRPSSCGTTRRSPGRAPLR